MIDRDTHETTVLDFAVAAEELGATVDIGGTVRTSSGFETEIAETDRVRISVVGATGFVVPRRSGRVYRTREPGNLASTIERALRTDAKYAEERAARERRVKRDRMLREATVLLRAASDVELALLAARAEERGDLTGASLLRVYREEATRRGLDTLATAV